MKPRQALEKAVQLHQAGQVEEARDIYRQVLASDPDNASATHLLGLTFLDGADWREGVTLIERAITLQPQTAVFHFNLSVCWRQRGDFERARSHLERATDLQLDYGEAWHSLVESHHYSEGGDHLAHIQAQLAGELSDENRCFFSFAAGKICDDIGDYATAFDNYQRGNRLRGIRWDSRPDRVLSESVLRYFDGQRVRSGGDLGLAEARPIFVVGMPRSGTSLVEQVLASHPQVYGAGELRDIATIADEMQKRVQPRVDYPDFLQHLPAEVFQGYARAYLERVAGLAGSPDLRVVDKQPFNFYQLGFIRQLFPQACIVHTTRDPLDTGLSCYFQNFARGVEFSFDLADIGAYYRLYRRLMDHWNSVMPGVIHELSYEALVSDPEPVVRALLNYCELPWDERCLEFAGTERRVTTASSWQVRQPLYHSSVGRHRHYAQQLAPLRDALQPP